jgi:hypothetical protein
LSFASIAWASDIFLDGLLLLLLLLLMVLLTA